MALVLTRRRGEKIIMTDHNTNKVIEVFILGVNRGSVKIGINAPGDIDIVREELIGRRNGDCLNLTGEDHE